jgi:hypothetical protein
MCAGTAARPCRVHELSKFCRYDSIWQHKSPLHANEETNDSIFFSTVGIVAERGLATIVQVLIHVWSHASGGIAPSATTAANNNDQLAWTIP